MKSEKRRGFCAKRLRHGTRMRHRRRSSGRLFHARLRAARPLRRLWRERHGRDLASAGDADRARRAARRRQRGRRGGRGGRRAVRGRAGDDRDRRRLLRAASAGVGRRGRANGSGRAPAAATVERLREPGSPSSRRTAHAVTVPGAIDAWARLLEAPRHAGAWTSCCSRRSAAPRRASSSRRASPATGRATASGCCAARPAGDYLPAGRRAPDAGQMMRLPALARTLRRIAETGPDASTRASSPSAWWPTSEARAGCTRSDDFAAAAASSCAPIQHRATAALEVYECPPNGQGVIALLMLNILEGFELAGARPERRRAAASRGRGDAPGLSRPRRLPRRSRRRPRCRVARLLDKGYAARLRAADRPRASAARRCRRRCCGAASRHGLPHRGRPRPQRGLVHQLALRRLRQRPGLPETGVLFHNRGRASRSTPRIPT